MDKKYYISDLHFSHKRVINYDNRPFSSIEEMDNMLMNNWNKVVSKNDTVYVVGDFIWSKEQEWSIILENLKGNIVLIKGNHDPKTFSSNTKRYFADIKDYKEIEDNGYKVIMCHYPIPFYNHDFDEKTIMLYGHVHTSLEYQYLIELQNEILKNKEEKGPKGNFINIGCMMPYMNYTPRTLEEILAANDKLRN